MNRRELIKNAAGIALGLTAVGAITDKALATRAWSHKDPTITVDGRSFDVDVAAWAEAPLHDFANFCTGAVDITVSVPTGVTSHSYTIASGDNAWGYGYNIHFATDSTLHSGVDGSGAFNQVSVVVNVPANVDTDGFPWNMKQTITSARQTDAITFRSGTPSNSTTIRV